MNPPILGTNHNKQHRASDFLGSQSTSAAQLSCHQQRGLRRLQVHFERALNQIIFISYD